MLFMLHAELPVDTAMLPADMQPGRGRKPLEKTYLGHGRKPIEKPNSGLGHKPIDQSAKNSAMENDELAKHRSPLASN